MKWISMLLVPALIVGNSLNARNADHFRMESRDTVIVPATIKSSFTTRYPTASRVVWYRYTPGANPPQPGVWYYNMDANDYYVTFVMNDVEHVAWYDNGNVIRTTYEADTRDLPDVVLRAIQGSYPGYVITDVDIERENGQTLYEVDVEKGLSRFELELNGSGAFIKKKDRSGTRADVQTAIMTDFESRYPEASEVVFYSYIPRDRVEIVPTDWDYNMDATDYEIRYKMNGTTYSTWYDNGTWVRTEAVIMDRNRLPASVQNAINREYAGYTVRDVEMEERGNGIVYEVELENASQRCKIHYGTDGSISKRKCVSGGEKTKSKS